MRKRLSHPSSWRRRRVVGWRGRTAASVGVEDGVSVGGSALPVGWALACDGVGHGSVWVSASAWEGDVGVAVGFAVVDRRLWAERAGRCGPGCGVGVGVMGRWAPEGAPVTALR